MRRPASAAARPRAAPRRARAGVGTAGLRFSPASQATVTVSRVLIHEDAVATAGGCSRSATTQTGDAAEVHDQCPATTGVQRDREHQRERRVPGERAEAAQRVTDQAAGRDQHRDDRDIGGGSRTGRDQSRPRRRRPALTATGPRSSGRVARSTAMPAHSRAATVVSSTGSRTAAQRRPTGAPMIELRTAHRAQPSHRESSVGIGRKAYAERVTRRARIRLRGPTTATGRRRRG